MLASGGDAVFAATRFAVATEGEGVAASRVTWGERRLELAQANLQAARAHVADANALPVAVDLDLPAFAAEVRRCEAAAAEALAAVDARRAKLRILKKAMHAARVIHMKKIQSKP